MNWINSYLSNRSYQFQIDGVLSEEAHCLSDVPQGSVIDLLLFLLYIIDLPATLGDSAFLFADDVKMVFPRSQSSCLLWELPINPNNCSCLTVGNSWIDLCKFCSPSSTIFVYIVTQDYLCFTYPQILICLCGYCWPAWPIIPLLNKIKKLIKERYTLPQGKKYLAENGVLISYGNLKKPAIANRKILRAYNDFFKRAMAFYCHWVRHFPRGSFTKL